MRDLAAALALTRLVPDFPQPGILFQDLTPIFADQSAFARIIAELSRYGSGSTVVAGIEARGFILGSAVAHNLELGFIPIRKKGKLPFDSISRSYGLEYGVDELEIHSDAFTHANKVFLIDDVLATGGTLIAAIELIEEAGGVIVGIGALSEVTGLGGREKIHNRFPALDLHILSDYVGQDNSHG